MAPKLGFAALLMVMAIASCIAIFVAACRHKIYHKIHLYEPKSIIAKLSILLLLVALFAQMMLIISFVNSDYSVKNVYQNSHHLKPLIYKIAASWGNHEGSMLLLISVLSVYNFVFFWFAKTSLPAKIYAAAVQNGIIALFCAYTLIASNPFLRNFPVPSQGLGLNPILQDIGLALHPPMLYTGYLGFSLVFAFAIGCLLANDNSKRSLATLRNLLYFAFAFLTLGIALGAWWAYRELGWGGYWFWDPVENVSLMPWIAAIALIHALKLAGSNLKMRCWTMFLVVATMILCLLGIFLTRSGVLNSIHSFAIDASRGLFIIFLIALIGGFGMLVLSFKLPKITSFSIGESPKNRRFSWLIIANNYFSLLALLTILIGTIYPILAQGLFKQFVTIGSDYYNQVFSIIILPFLVFLITASCPEFKIFSKRNFGIAVLAFLLAAMPFLWHFEVTFSTTNFLRFLALFLAICALIMNCADLFLKKDKIAKKLVFVAHGGFLLVIIGVIATSTFGLEKAENMRQKQTISLGNFDLRFEEIGYAAGSNFIARQAVFSLSRYGAEITKLRPQLRYYPVNDQTTNESAIYHGLFGDFYVVIGNKDEAENYAVRAYHKPLISLIWLGAFLIFAAVIGQLGRNSWRSCGFLLKNRLWFF